VDYTFTGCTQQQLGRALTGTLTFSNEGAKTITWTIPVSSSITTFTITLSNPQGFSYGGTLFLTLTRTGSSETSHIHLVAGNPTITDIYLGDDDQYVKIEKNAGNVVIGTNTDTNHWTFGTDGSLTLPQGSTIDEATEIVTVTLDQFTDGSYPGTQVFNKVSATLYQILPSGPTIELVGGIWKLAIGVSVYYESADLITWTALGGGLPTPVGTLGTLLTMNLGVGSNVWAFGTDGGITFPTGGTQYVAYTGGSTGYTGSQGVGFTGSSGTTGFTGSTGPAATVGTLNYVQNSQATSTSMSASPSLPFTVISAPAITTNGSPVQIIVTGDANPLSNGAWCLMRLYRGSTIVGQAVQAESINSNINVPYCIQFVDAVAAGTYTYSMKVTSNAGAFNFGEATGPVITVTELQNVIGDRGYTGSSGTNGVVGYNGSTGYTGSASTVIGYSGSKGADGNFGGAAFNYYYSKSAIDTIPGPGPGAGYIAFGNVSFSSTSIMRISYIDKSTVSVESFLQTVDDSTSAIKGHFSVTDKNNSDVYAIFAITGLHSEHTDHFDVPVAHITGETSFDDLTEVIVTFARTGDVGDQGPPGYTGSASEVAGYTGSASEVAGYTGSASDVIGYTGSEGVGYTGSASEVIGYTGSEGVGYTGSASEVIGYTGSASEVAGYTGSASEVIGYTGSASEVAGYTGSASEVIGYTGSEGIGYTGSEGKQPFNIMGDWVSGYTYDNGNVVFDSSANGGDNQYYIVHGGSYYNTINPSQQHFEPGNSWDRFYITSITGYTGSASEVIGYTGSEGVGYTGSASTEIGYWGSVGYTGSTSTGYTGSRAQEDRLVSNSYSLILNADATTSFPSNTLIVPNGANLTVSGGSGTPIPNGIIFNGSSSYMTIPSSTDWIMGKTWTFEFRIKLDATSVGTGVPWRIINQEPDYAVECYMGITLSGGEISILCTQSNALYYAEPTVGQWVHVAIVNNNSGPVLYYDGVAQTYTQGYGGPANWTSSNAITIGRYPNNNYQYFPGSISGLRISNVPRYTANFIPTAEVFEIDNNLLLLMNVLTGAEYTDSSSYNRTVSHFNTTIGSIPGIGLLPGNVAVNAGGNVWSFNTDGSLKLPSSGKIINTTEEWTFGNDGTITLPAGGTISEANIGITDALILTPANIDYLDQQLRIYSTVGVGEGNHLHLTTGNLYTSEIYLGDDNYFVKLNNNGNVQIQAATQSLSATSSWMFDTDGTLTVPTVVWNYVPVTFTSIPVTYGETGLNFTVQPDNTITDISVAYGAGGYGPGSVNLTIPGTIFPGGTNPANNIVFNVQTFESPGPVYATATNSAVSYVSGTPPRRYDNFASTGNSNVGIGAGNQHWVFGTDGGITFPNGVTQYVAYTGGATGYTGSLGYFGSVGYTGSQGEIGYTGSVGYTGSASEVVGYTGSEGIGYTGSASEVVGYTGSASEVIGYTGSEGIGYTGSASEGIGYTGSASEVIGYTGSEGYTGSIGYTGSSAVVAYGSTIRTASGPTITVDFSSDGVVLYTNTGTSSSITVGFANYVVGKRVLVIIQNTSDSSNTIVTLGVPKEQSVAGDTVVLDNGKLAQFLEYISFGTDINSVFLSTNKP
jgi:hypothetical protein